MKRTILNGLLFGLMIGAAAYLLFTMIGTAGAETKSGYALKPEEAAGHFAEESKASEWIYEDPEENRKIEEALDWHYLEGVTLTAYCPCIQCCGCYALDRPGGIVYTASGAVAKAGQTIAVDPDVIPLGAWVEINGQLYHAEDTGNFGGKHIDVYFDRHEEAWDFGRRTGVAVRWYE